MLKRKSIHLNLEHVKLFIIILSNYFIIYNNDDKCIFNSNLTLISN